MQIGIFSKTFVRPDLASCLDGVVEHQLAVVQFNFACAGLPTLPDHIDASTLHEIRGAIEERHLQIAAVSATFNMIDPNLARRRDGLRRLAVVASAAHALGAPMITLCTGTRHANDMWQSHPENASPAAWRDLLNSMEQAVEIAERHQVDLGIEPETNNVVASAQQARRLLDELRSPRLKIVMDPANLFWPGQLRRQGTILSEAFQILGPDLRLAHAKDVQEKDGTLAHVAAGRGQLDYDLYARLLGQAGFTGPIILHGLTENEVTPAVRFLAAILSSHGM